MEFIILAVIIYFIIKALGNSDSSSSNQDLSTKHDGISPVQPDRKPSVIPDSFFNSYQNLLKEYYRKYKDQVFQKRILSEIQQKISFERDMSEIKHDIKMIRQELNFSPEKSEKNNADVKVSKQSAVPRQPGKRSNPHRILICDDAAFMRMMLKDTLTQDGYEVVAEAQNGLEAIERYSEFKPDLVFMDITMPKMDGIDATREIKKMDSRANIVICSAMGQAELVMEAIRLGAKDFIVKPFTKEAILKAVMKIFEPWRFAKPPVETEQSQTPPEESNHDNLEKREVDKDFGKRNQKHGDFYFYVVNMTDTQLINTINGQYKSIKGSWTLAPHMGEYGSVEFAAVLLLWKYAVNNFVRNPESYASLQITLGDIICCAFFGMTAGEWSDKVDPILNAHSDIVSYKEFRNVYNYLRNNYIDKIHSLEFNDGNMQEEVYRQFYAKFTEIYNSTNGFKEMLDFYTSKGLKIKDDIHFNVANDKNDILKHTLLRKWKSKKRNLEEDADIQQLPPLLTDKFYISSYRCPFCGRHMYKTVFPIGGEFPIRTADGYISMKRVFTCKTCLKFFTPLPEHKLSCGQYYSLKLKTLDEYKMLLETFDNHGTTDGRPDA